MMHELVTTNRAMIIAHTTDAGQRRSSPVASGLVEHGVPRFLSQLAQALLLDEQGGSTRELRAIVIGESAARHGGELLALGFTVSQVVHAYGDICQAITKIALAQGTPISVGEFQILNHSLDDAIAGALTEHARLTAIALTTNRPRLPALPLSELPRMKALLARRRSSKAIPKRADTPKRKL
jgi:hypothetical protein